MAEYLSYVWRWAIVNDCLAFVDYYLSAYGPTIRIATRNRHWLVALKKQIMDLSNGNLDSIDVCKFSDTKCSETINELILIKGINCSVSCVTAKDLFRQTNFIWVQDESGIETILGLIDGLIVSDQSGHQYLTNEGDGYLIELSYNE